MKFLRDRRNANGHMPEGASSYLSTKDDSDNILSAAAAGGGGIGAQFRAPGLPAAGLALDFNADDIAGADGSAPTVWVDASGFNVAATVGAGAPLLKTGANGINGHNVVRFIDGGGAGFKTCYFRLPVDVTKWQGFTAYYVARSGSGSGSTQWGGVFGWQLANSIVNLALGSATDGQGAGWAGATGAVSLGNVTNYAPRSVFYASYRYDKTDWTIEGVNSNTVADTAWPTGAGDAWIGTNYYPDSQSDNDVARIVVYNRRLTDAEDAQVKAYLQYIYGLAAEPGRQLVVGYPETLTNTFLVRYVHPAGDDSNDGKTWPTAKKTFWAARLSAVTENPAAAIRIYMHDLSYWGGPVSDNGLWVNASASSDGDPGPGWICNRNGLEVIGVGGTPDNHIFSPIKARIYQGNPVDPQTIDKMKPLIWVSGGGGSNTIRLESMKPVDYGFIRLGVNAGYDGTSNTIVDRAGNLENCRFRNLGAASPPDTAPVFGPAWDIGWVNVCWVKDISAAGSATMTAIPLAAGDGATSPDTLSLTNGNFTLARDLGGGIVIDSGPNSGVWVVQSVVSPTAVTVAPVSGTRTLVNETFSTETIQKFPGPQILQDDDHAAILIRPTDVDGTGQPGSLGAIYFENVGTLVGGIKQYLGADGGAVLYVKRFLSEEAPQPYAVSINLMPGATVPTLVSGNTIIDLDTVSSADQLTASPYTVWIDPVLHDGFGTGTIKYKDIGGPVFGPGMWAGNDNVGMLQLPTQPNAQRIYGWTHGGRLNGRHEAGRRLGAPATAQGSYSGGVGNHVTNLASHDPSTYTGPAGHFTAGDPDIFGMSNAATIDALDPGGAGNQITVAANPSAVAETWSDGDYVVIGVYGVGLDGPLDSYPTVSMASGSLTPVGEKLAYGPWEGNKDWQWACGAYVYKTPAGTPVTDSIILKQPSSLRSRISICYPKIVHYQGISLEELTERTANAGTWNPALAQGAVGTLRGQPVVASGGLGEDPSVLVTPSGTDVPTKNEPRLGADGRTIIGYLPVLPTNSNLGYEPAISWPASTRVLVSTGSGPAGYSGFTYASGPGNLAVPGSISLGGVTASSIVALDSGHFAAPVTVDAPLTYNGVTGHLGSTALPPDGVSITTNGSSQAQRAALTGDVSAAAGSNAVKVSAVTDLASVQWSVGTLANGSLLATSSVGSIIKTVPLPLCANLAYQWGHSQVTWSSYTGYLYTSSDTNYAAGGGDYVLGVAAVSLTFNINVDTSSLTGATGFWRLTVYRNGVATTATFSMTDGATGPQTTTIAITGGAVTDKYALFLDTGGGMTGGSVGMTAVILVQSV